MKNKQFLPYGFNIRVKPHEKDQILRTDTFCEYGTVIAIGEGVKNIQVGDEISFWLFGIKEVQHENERHFIIPVDDRFILEIKRNEL